MLQVVASYCFHPSKAEASEASSAKHHRSALIHATFPTRFLPTSLAVKYKQSGFSRFRSVGEVIPTFLAEMLPSTSPSAVG